LTVHKQNNLPSASADVLLVSNQYTPESVGWRMPRKSQFRR